MSVMNMAQSVLMSPLGISVAFFSFSLFLAFSFVKVQRKKEQLSAGQCVTCYNCNGSILNNFFGLGHTRKGGVCCTCDKFVCCNCLSTVYITTKYVLKKHQITNTKQGNYEVCKMCIQRGAHEGFW